MARMAVLGGERGNRGLFGGSRSRLEWAGIGVFVLAAVLTAAIGRAEWYMLLAGSVLLLTGFAAFTPFARFGERTWAALRLQTWHTRRRQRRGTSSFLNPVTGDPDWVPGPTLKRMEKEERKAAKKGDAYRPADAPLAVGTMRWFEVPTGPRSSVVAFKDSTRAQGAYIVIVETTGTGSGITDEDGYDAPYLAFGALLSFLAGMTSLITHIQPLTRALPMDATDHLSWMAGQIGPGVPEVLVESYAELTESVQAQADQHRSYYALLIPDTPALERKADRYGPGDEGMGQAVLDELARFAGRASSTFGIRGLGAVHAAALFRSLQDPRFDIDDLDGADLKTCWQTFDGTESQEYLRINAGPVSRFGFIAKEDFEATALPVQMFQPLIKDVNPSVIRTVTIIDELMPAKQARARARADVTTDTAGADKSAGVVTDGSEEVLLGASRQRLQDLRPGTGFHGLGYGMYLSITADSPAELMAASDVVDAACSDSGIEHITWLDGRHDLAFITCLPLARGLRR
ncbi:hypothetical protein ABH924_004342 [Arthrobacter sp. GAS37]|uniref:YgaP family membrane protein n=1 Tax=Arthrobacter sp. GAS37 TaxID=3156261 RepID=UPI003832FFF8